MDVMKKATNDKRLIDVNDIYSLFNQSGIARLHVSDIDTIPRVDAVEVVRCRNCREWKTIGKDEILGTEIGLCDCSQWENDYYNIETDADDFCSYGERKEGADNG